MVSVCLPSDALLQCLPTYLGFFYLGHGVSLHGCSSKAQPLLLTLDEGYLLTAAPPDLEHGIAPPSPPSPHSHCSLDVGLLLPATAPDLGRGVAPLGWQPPALKCALKVRNGGGKEILLVQGKEQRLRFAGADVKR